MRHLYRCKRFGEAYQRYSAGQFDFDFNYARANSRSHCREIFIAGADYFKQRRYGLNGDEITVYKFRSMTVCENGNEVKQAQRNDARHAGGGVYRKTSLMSCRSLLMCCRAHEHCWAAPHAVAHNELYRKQIKGYMIRHKVKPGITGWAQVNGLRVKPKPWIRCRRELSSILITCVIGR